MRSAFTNRSARTVLLTAVALAIGGVVTAYLWEGEEPATATPSLTALDGMADAMGKPETELRVVPALIARLVVRTDGGGDISSAGVRRLLSSVGKSRTSFYMWPGGGESVCYASTGGGGGCFANFLGPFNISITDRDLLGSGEPLQVSGPVRGDVVAVEVVIDGRSGEALVQNQVAFFEAPDASSLPSDVERVTVTLADGTKENVRV